MSIKFGSVLSYAVTDDAQPCTLYSLHANFVSSIYRSGQRCLQIQQQDHAPDILVLALWPYCNPSGAAQSSWPGGVVSTNGSTHYYPTPFLFADCLYATKNNNRSQYKHFADSYRLIYISLLGLRSRCKIDCYSFLETHTNTSCREKKTMQNQWLLLSCKKKNHVFKY